MTEALSRLAAKTQSLEGMPSGGIPEFSGVEMAGVLAGLPRGPELLIRASRMGDETVREELEQILLVKASKWFRVEDIAYPGMLRALCGAILSQSIDPPRCRRCMGRGVIFHRGGRVDDCERCGGSGRGAYGGDPLRRLLGLSTARWRRMQGPIKNLEMTLAGWASHASGHIGRELKKNTP